MRRFGGRPCTVGAAHEALGRREGRPRRCRLSLTLPPAPAPNPLPNPNLHLTHSLLMRPRWPLVDGSLRLTKTGWANWATFLAFANLAPLLLHDFPLSFY